MYNSIQGGYTVSITKEKFLNTYPPLFNPARLQQCRRAGFFIDGGDLCAERADYRFTAGICALNGRKCKKKIFCKNRQHVIY